LTNTGSADHVRFLASALKIEKKIGADLAKGLQRLTMAAANAKTQYVVSQGLTKHNM
jgi:hypothetical protein